MNIKGHRISVRVWGAVTVSVLALGGGGIALAEGGASARKSLTATHSRAFYRRLVARKLREGHRLHPAAATAGQTYPTVGVTIGPPSSAASSQAASSSMTSASDVMASVGSQPASAAFGSAFSNGNASASLQTVTESSPVVSGVTPGSPYQAWVITGSGPPLNLGGTPIGHDSPPTTGTCRDVAIYDIDNATWTEFFQSC